MLLILLAAAHPYILLNLLLERTGHAAQKQKNNYVWTQQTQAPALTAGRANVLAPEGRHARCPIDDAPPQAVQPHLHALVVVA